MTQREYHYGNTSSHFTVYSEGGTIWPGHYGMCAFCGSPIEAPDDVFSVPGKGDTKVTLHRSCLGELLTRVIALVKQDK